MPKSKQSSGRPLGTAVATERRGHEVGQEKRQKIARLHKEEYSADNSHSASHMEMFRAMRVRSTTREICCKAVQHMGISVNGKKEYCCSSKEKEEAKKLAGGLK